MVVYIEPTDVIWNYKGYDDGTLAYPTNYWSILSPYQTAACEYAYQNNIDEISIKNNEYVFDIKNNFMYINDVEMIFQPIPIKRSC